MLKQIFLINTDLKMGIGKCCVQVAHGETLYMDDVMLAYCSEGTNLLYDMYEQWKQDNIKPIGLMTKVVLKSDETTMRNIASLLPLKGIKCYEVYDLGKTQVKKGSFTCLCMEPLEEDIADKYFGHLKLL